VRKIVVGVNDREEALDALRLARELARSEDAEVVSVAAHEVGPDGESERRFVETTESRASEALAGLSHRHIAVSETPAARALGETAEDEEADLVVVGSTHRGPLGSVLPGSVGDQLLSGAPCAVAIAPRGYARGAHPGLGIVGVGYDGSEESRLALREAVALARERDAELRVVTVVPDLTWGEEPLIARDSVKERFRETLDGALAMVPDAVTTAATLELGDPAAVLARHGVDVDILVVGSRRFGPLRRVLLGSTSADLVRSAPSPVLVVPRGAKEPAGDPLSSGDPVA
jgi:nucleotide-binding universal stress UspA family protein